jgi:hypothetical protein
MTYPGLVEFAGLVVRSCCQVWLNSGLAKTEVGLLLVVAEKGGALGPTPTPAT